MGAREARGGLDAATRRLIRFKAWELAQNSAFTPDDQEDIQQELALDLLRRLAKYDACRGKRTAFVRRVVENKVTVLLQHQLAQRRDPHRVAFSLNEAIEDNEGNALLRDELVAPEELDEEWRPPVEDHDLRVDLARAIYRLPLDLAELARRLATQSVTEIAESTGIPRGTLYDAIERIRAVLGAAGLQEYFGGLRRF